MFDRHHRILSHPVIDGRCGGRSLTLSFRSDARARTDSSPCVEIASFFGAIALLSKNSMLCRVHPSDQEPRISFFRFFLPDSL